MRHHRWADPEIQAQLAAKSAMGLSATEIARDMGEGREAVKRAMTRYGLFASSRPERRNISLPMVGGLSNDY